MLIKKILDGCKRKQFLLDFFNDQALAQLKRYLVIGFLSFTLEYGLFFILSQIFKLWYIYANSIALAVVFWFNFLLNRYWSFR